MVLLGVLVGGAGGIVFPQQNVYLQRKNSAEGGVGTAEAAFGLEVRSYFPLETFFYFPEIRKVCPNLNFGKPGGEAGTSRHLSSLVVWASIKCQIISLSHGEQELRLESLLLLKALNTVILDTFIVTGESASSSL